MHASTLQFACLLLAQVAPPANPPALENPPAAPRLAPLNPTPAGAPSLLGQPTLAEPTDSKSAPPVNFPADAGRSKPLTDTPPASATAPVSQSQSPTLRPDAPAETLPPQSPASKPAAKTGAAALLAHAFESRQGSVDGEPITLLAAIQQPENNTTRLAAVKAYWQLSLAVADHHHALGEVDYLANLPLPQSTHDQTLLRAAEAAARARQSEAKLALVAAQHDLGQASAAGAANPLPTDVPYVGRYRTNFAEIFASQPAPAALRRIDRTLPLFHELIDARAESVVAAGEALMALTGRYEQGQETVPTLITAFLQLRQQRIALLASIRDYNYSIADYALSVASPGISREAIVAMLIETTPQTRSVLVPRGRVKPVAAEVPVEQQLVPVKPAEPTVPATIPATKSIDLAPAGFTPQLPAVPTQGGTFIPQPPDLIPTPER